MLSSYIDNDNDDNDNKNPEKAARIISNLNHKNTKLCVSVKPILCFFNGQEFKFSKFPPKIMYCFWSFYLKFMLKFKNKNKTKKLRKCILCSTNILNIDNNWNLENQISMLEWFLKDHVTLNTKFMGAENSALQSQE